MKILVLNKRYIVQQLFQNGNLKKLYLASMAGVDIIQNPALYEKVNIGGLFIY